MTTPPNRKTPLPFPSHSFCPLARIVPSAADDFCDQHECAWFSLTYSICAILLFAHAAITIANRP